MNVPNPIRARLGLPAMLVLGLCVPTGCLLGPAALAALANGASPSPSSYGVSALCAEPAPGYSGCLGLRLVAGEPLSVPGTSVVPAATSAPGGESSEAVEHKEVIGGSLSPSNVLSAYNLTGVSPPSRQTIALVDAFDDATVEADLAVFDSQFGLPACTEANGCFRKVNQSGNHSPLPPSGGKAERGWAQEIATDVEVAHGVCPSCRILLVEAQSNENEKLYTAEQTAAALGATEISNSWGGEEPATDNPAFNQPGVVITASSGDNGYLNWFEEGARASADYPASSPRVIAVGGTRLKLNGGTWSGESAWNDGGESGVSRQGFGAGGGGCSEVFSAPFWQQSVADWSSVGCGNARAVADVSADADPYTGVAVYDSTESEGSKGWAMIGGTSVASPIIASAFALAGGSQGVEYPARTLYLNELNAPASLHDVTVGSNGECLKPFNKKTGASGCTSSEEAQSCSAHAICLALPGYDGPTGVGTPAGIRAFQTSGPSASAPASGRSPGSVLPAPGVSSPGAAQAPAATSAVPTVSALSLTRPAIVALNRKRPKVSKVAFSFTISAPARVRVTIAKRVRVHGRLQWKTISAPFEILAAGGRQSRRLSGRGALAAGRYRLTLTPARGASRSIIFRIG